jgi:hypothetical protein
MTMNPGWRGWEEKRGEEGREWDKTREAIVLKYDLDRDGQPRYI